MNYPPILMNGRTIMICRYSVTYITESKIALADDYFPTKAEAELAAENRRGTINILDTTTYEWMDGIEVADVPDTFAEAVKIYEMGQAAYQELLNTPTPEEDTMAMMVDHEYRLTILEVMS